MTCFVSHRARSLSLLIISRSVYSKRNVKAKKKEVLTNSQVSIYKRALISHISPAVTSINILLLVSTDSFNISADLDVSHHKAYEDWKHLKTGEGKLFFCFFFSLFILFLLGVVQ